MENKQHVQVFQEILKQLNVLKSPKSTFAQCVGMHQNLAVTAQGATNTALAQKTCTYSLANDTSLPGSVRAGGASHPHTQGLAGSTTVNPKGDAIPPSPLSFCALSHASHALPFMPREV
jgi:hypothetical protein